MRIRLKRPHSFGRLFFGILIKICHGTNISLNIALPVITDQGRNLGISCAVYAVDPFVICLCLFNFRRAVLFRKLTSPFKDLLLIIILLLFPVDLHDIHITGHILGQFTLLTFLLTYFPGPDLNIDQIFIRIHFLHPLRHRIFLKKVRLFLHLLLPILVMILRYLLALLCIQSKELFRGIIRKIFLFRDLCQTVHLSLDRITDILRYRQIFHQLIIIRISQLFKVLRKLKPLLRVDFVVRILLLCFLDFRSSDKL